MSRQRSDRYAVRSGMRTYIPDIQNPRWRFTMLEGGLPRITARKFHSVVLKLLKVIGFITKSSNEQYFAYQNLQKKYLPIYRMVLMTLRVTWSHGVQYNYWNWTIVKSKANFDAFRTSMFILLFCSPNISRLWKLFIQPAKYLQCKPIGQ